MTTSETVRQQLELDPELATRVLADFVRDGVETAGMHGVVVGLSGGIDSAVAAAVATRALGIQRVHALCLPHADSSDRAAEDSALVAESLGLELVTIDITPMVDPYFERYEPDADELRRGNKMARERMSVLFDQAKKCRSLVLGTSNKTEILLGYSTIFGDNASSLNPLGDLYKCQVGQLARHLDIPERVVEKTPSADLWPGQTDEEDLGFAYQTADEVLYLLFDVGMTASQVIDSGYDRSTVERILEREERYRFKRRLMLVARLSGSAVNLDREIPRD